ncbi:late competence development ComFB family protein [Oceanispirochaeta sp.]|uniref:late competence development ComFB family protein n=1 Tax=Oceanispirochaeta sp. TaxID=2035350 RepID=UPI0026245A7E|nr:late competence development ComFB family protein [Oceanispirochaeta sp.]MDA3956631.1 late competence development ComFB family protein [Oceanispirochaeta sp.]
MSFFEDYNLDEIKNEVEEVAFRELERQLRAIRNEDICKCIDCVQDMACFALNQIKPRYAVSLLGSIFTKVETETLIKDIETVVQKSIEKISQNPLHSKS